MNFKIKFYYEEKGIILNFWLWWKYGKIDIINIVYIFKIVVLEKIVNGMNVLNLFWKY